MFEEFYFLLIPLGIAAFIGVIIYIFYLFEKKRTENLKNYAGQHGYSFEAKKQMQDIPVTGRFKIFTKGHSNRIKNYMSSRKRGIHWEIFDYRYTIGAGKNSHTYNQTMIAAKVDKSVPAFAMGPESFLHRFAEVFGYHDIDFESHPKFSKDYLLKSNDANIKSLFTSDILSFFESIPIVYNVEATAMNILVYKQGKRAKPEELKSFIDSAERIVDKIGR